MYHTGEYTEITNDNPGGSSWNDGCYVVTGNNVIIDDRVTVSGYVYLILVNGSTLTVNGGIIDDYSDYCAAGIYGGGEIIIYGGTVALTGTYIP